MIRISIAEAGKSPQLLTYNSSAITLGRLAQNDLCLTGKGVSGTHCRILREGDAYFIEDLGSTNGTYVNRQRVQGRQSVTSTDDVVLAIYRLRVLSEAESGVSQMPGPPMPEPGSMPGSMPGPMSGPTPYPPMGASGEAPRMATPGVRQGFPTAHMAPPSGAMPMANPVQGPSSPSQPPSGPSQGPTALHGSGVGSQLRSGASPVSSGLGASSRSLSGSSGPGPTPAEMAWGREWELIDKLATAWLASGKSNSELLRGDKLAHARQWLSQGRGKRPPPKPLHRDFIMAGASGKLLRTLGGVMSVAIVLGGLGVGGWFLYEEYEGERSDGDDPPPVLDLGGGGVVPKEIDSGDAEASAALAAKAGGLVAEDPVLAVLLAAEAVVRLPRDAATPDAAAFTVLREALRDLPGRPLRGHEGPVERVVLSPDGRWAVTAGTAGGDVHLWDLDRAGVLNPSSLRGHPRGLTAMEVSRDGRWLVTADADGLAMRWSLLDPDPAATGARLEDHRAPITALDVSSDGHWLVSGDESGQVKTWDLEAALPSAFTLPSGHTGKVTGVATNDDGSRVVSSGEDMTARNWKVSGGRAKKPVVVVHEEVVVTSVALAPDDSWAVTGGADGEVRLWSPTTRIPTRKWERLPGHKGEVSIVEVSADSSMAVSVAADNDLWIWDLKAKVPSASSVRLSGHSGRIIQLAIYSPPAGVPEARHVPTSAFTASADGTARSWDLDQRKTAALSRVFSGHKEGGVRSVAASGDGQWAITGGADRVARVWDWQSLPTGEPASEQDLPRVGSASRVGRGHTAPVLAAAVDPFGRRMITGSADGTARVWDMRHPTRLRSLPFQDLHTDRVRAVAVSPADKWAMSGDNAGRLVIWDIQADVPVGRSLVGHSGEIGAVAFTPDGKRAVSVSTDRTARVWTISENPEDGVVVLQHDDEVTQLAVGGDGRWLLTGTLTSAFLWDLQSSLEAPTKTFKGHENDLTAVALDPRGRWAATGSADRKILLYDLHDDDSKATAKLRQHEDAVKVLAFHPQGKWLASGSADKPIFLWDLKSPHPDESPMELSGHSGGIADLEWSADGRWLVSSSNDGTVRLWDTTKDHKEMVEEVIVLEGHTANTVVPQVALIPGEESLSMVVSVGYDGTARMWPLEPLGLLELACTAAGRRLSEDEWSEYEVGGKYDSACK